MLISSSNKAEDSTKSFVNLSTASLNISTFVFLTGGFTFLYICMTGVPSLPIAPAALLKISSSSSLESLDSSLAAYDVGSGMETTFPFFRFSALV